MIDDPVAETRLANREVRTGSRDGEVTKIAVIRRTYATDQTDLWDALSNPDRLPRWFLPVNGDLSVGGRYQLAGNAGGTVEECDEPERLRLTWEFGEMLSWVAVTLTPTDGGTTLELMHEAAIADDLWEQFGPGAAGIGWDLALIGLGLHIQSGEAVDPEVGAAFATTPEGTEFVELAAADWADAAIDDGDDPDAAREAAARTVAFYTVAPEDAAVEGSMEQ